MTIMANITGDRNFTSKLGLASPAGVDEFFSALNIFLSITASLGNALILVALYKVSSIHPPTKLFFQSLAVADLCVGLIVQPLFAVFLLSRITEVNEDVLYYMYEVSRASSWILCAVSVLTSTAIGVDRLLALLLKQSYRQVVTLRRTKVLVFNLWILAAVATAMYFLNYDLALQGTIIVVSLYLATSIFSYVWIFFALRHHQSRVQNVIQRQSSQTTPVNIARYKKAASSALWLQFVLVACYLPYGVVVAMWAHTGLPSVVFLVAQCTITLVYLNSSLNPLIYCWKIKELRQVVKQTVRKFFSSWS